MAHVAPIYPNFARGEVSPLMFGRVDIEQYPTCLDKCRNTYIRPYGCATRLTGTEFISDTKNSGKVRLLKFVFSATDSYIIECGAGYFRFYQDGAVILDGNDEPYEITNTYSEAQLDSIQYVQLDDIIKLTCLPDPNHPTVALRGNAGAHPKELIRNASNNWTFRDVTFKETPYLDQNTSSITLNPDGTTGSINIVSSSAYFDSKMIGANFWIGTKVTDSTTNKDVQGFVKITNVTDSTHATATVQSKLSGTGATKLWGEGAFSDYRGYPSCVALYDGRLWYARTPYQPRNMYGSKPYAYETFTPAVDNEDDAGINIQLATNANGDGSDIKWMIGASYLLCGTYGGEFVIRGSGDGAITATDISARQRTNWGGEPVQPIVAGTFVHFLQRNGNKLRQFQYDFYYDSYKAVDVSIFSEHLLSSPIKEMALQKNPDSIIYLMREDGNVVMLTLEQDQSVQAWSLLEELGAQVESIQTIPSYHGNYDEVYLVMKRNALETILSYTSSNPNLTITDNYSGTKETEGEYTEVLEFLGYETDNYLLRKNSNPNFITSNGYATFANGYYYVTEMGGYKSFVVKLTTSDNITTSQNILNISRSEVDNETGLVVEISEGDLLLKNYRGGVLRDTWTIINGISGNTDYWIKFEYSAPVYFVRYSLDGTTWVLPFSGISTSYLASSYLNSIGTSPINAGIPNYFKGTIDLKNTYIYSATLSDYHIYLATSSNSWFSVTKDEKVDISSPEYALTITGDLEGGDTITLTYETDFTGAERFIERMQDPITPVNPYDWWYVRSGLKYDGFNRTEGIKLTLSANSGTVTATTDNNIFAENMVGNRIRFIDDDYNILGEGEITAFTDETEVTLNITTYFQSSEIAGGKWGISTDVVSGLDHLDGRTVQVYADTKEQENKTVVSGSINIDDAFVVVAGLPYTSYITTMPMEAGSQNGTAVGKRKRISEMAIRVWNSIGVKVGRDLDNLYDAIYQQKEPFTGVIPNIKYNQGWVWDANITVEQSHPYPMNILSIAPIVTEVDK